MTNANAPNAASAWADQIEVMGIGNPPGLPAPIAIGAAKSGAFLARMLASAARLLPKFATGTVEIVRRGELETGVPARPFVTEEQRYPRHAYVGGFPSDRIDGKAVMASDLRVIFAADSLPIRPTAADAIDIDNARLSVVRVAAVPAAGAPVLYVVQARAA